MKNILKTSLFCLMISLGSLSLASEITDIPKAPAGQESFTTLVGAAEFQNEVMSSPFLNLSEADRSAIQQAGIHYGHAIRIESGEMPAMTPLDAQFNRNLGDQKLMGVMKEFNSLIPVDITKGELTGDWDDPMLVPSESGDVILKVVTGSGSPEFRIQEMVISHVGEKTRPTVTVSPDATTYLLLKLREIPTDRSVLLLEYQFPGDTQPRYWGNIVIEAKKRGNLRVTILDENGQETPALVRLQSNENGMLWDIPSAIDLGPIMTQVTGLPIYGPGKGYTYFMPGQYRGPYWVVPDAFETVIPTGSWTMMVHHGVEYTPVTQTIDVSGEGWTDVKVQLERWADFRERGWYSGDDHVHARILSNKDAEKVLAWGTAANVNVINVLEMGNEQRSWYEQRGFGPEFREQKGDHVIVPGQEDPRSMWGHIIGLNLTSMARNLDHYMLNDLIADEIHRQGGLYGQTHVGEGGLGIIRDLTWLSPLEKSDFASIMQNVLGTERYYAFLNLGFRLTASAGSDTPYGGAVGVTRVYAYIGEGKEFTADAWFDAVKKGNTFVTNGPLIDMKVEDVFRPGDEIPVSAETPALKVNVEAIGSASDTAPSRISLIWNGNVIHTALNKDPNTTTLNLDYELAPEFGGWLAAKVDSFNGAQAHTTPVYVHREGFRTWNMDLVEGLINDRLATLAEMENIAKTQQGRLESGTMDELDYWNVWVAKQADQVLERTQKSREFYEGLRETYQKEKELRAVSE